MLAAAFCNPARAGTEDGLAAVQNGDFAAAADALYGSLEKGMNAAYEAVAAHFDRNLGTVEALIGDVYYFGHGVSRDYGEALRMYRRAAQRGNAMAQSALGDIYYYGRGAPQDFGEAVKWWSLAAESNIGTAQLNLSVMYANGDGAPQDFVKAHLYASLAAANLPPGKDQEATLKNREILERLMTPAQLAEAKRLALERASTSTE
jgi:TPR repeat protein